MGPEASSLRKDELVSVLLGKRRQVLIHNDFGPWKLHGRKVVYNGGDDLKFKNLEGFRNAALEEEARAKRDEATIDSNASQPMSQSEQSSISFLWDDVATEANSPGALLKDHQLDSGYAADSIADAMDRIGEDAGERESAAYMAAYISDDEGLTELRSDSKYDRGGDIDGDGDRDPFMSADPGADGVDEDEAEFAAFMSRMLAQDGPDSGSEGDTDEDARWMRDGAASDSERGRGAAGARDAATAASPAADDGRRARGRGADDKGSTDAGGLMDPRCAVLPPDL